MFLAVTSKSTKQPSYYSQNLFFKSHDTTQIIQRAGKHALIYIFIMWEQRVLKTDDRDLVGTMSPNIRERQRGGGLPGFQPIRVGVCRCPDFSQSELGCVAAWISANQVQGVSLPGFQPEWCYIFIATSHSYPGLTCGTTRCGLRLRSSAPSGCRPGSSSPRRTH